MYLMVHIRVSVTLIDTGNRFTKHFDTVYTHVDSNKAGCDMCQKLVFVDDIL